MQMNALRSANFAKLSSNSSTSDEYWVTSMSDGTPAGYCLSQIRSMVFPSLFICYFSRLFGPGPSCFRQYWQCSPRWQAAARYRRISYQADNAVNGAKAAEIAGAASFLAGRLGLVLGFCGGLRL